MLPNFRVKCFAISRCFRFIVLETVRHSAFLLDASADVFDFSIETW